MSERHLLWSPKASSTRQQLGEQRYDRAAGIEGSARVVLAYAPRFTDLALSWQIGMLAHMEKGESAVEQARAALTEFTTLRAEIANRSTAQYTLVAITLVAASTLGGFALGPKHVNPSVLLLLGPICTATGLLWLDHAHAIYQIGDYVRNKLWPFVGARLSTLYTGGARSTSATKVEELPSYETYAVAGKQIPIERGVLLFPFGLIFVFTPAVSTFIVIKIENQPWIYAAAAVDALLILTLLFVWILFLSRVLRTG